MIWHDALIHKLRKIDTPQQILNIIQSYLHNRQMFVTINGTKSSIKQVRAGVLRDSILGPMLYNIFTNDIPISNKTQLAIYADDTAVYSSSWSPRQATRNIQAHLDLILDYFVKWKLRVNPDKTKAITFMRYLNTQLSRTESQYRAIKSLRKTR